MWETRSIQRCGVHFGRIFGDLVRAMARARFTAAAVCKCFSFLAVKGCG